MTHCIGRGTNCSLLMIVFISIRMNRRSRISVHHTLILAVMDHNTTDIWQIISLWCKGYPMNEWYPFHVRYLYDIYVRLHLSYRIQLHDIHHHPLLAIAPIFGCLPLGIPWQHNWISNFHCWVLLKDRHAVEITDGSREWKPCKAVRILVVV